MKVRLSSLLAMTGAILTGTLLFWTSQKVQISEARLRQIREAVAGEENTIRVLNAEWAYLTRPDRLEHLAKTYLGMKPVSPDQVAAGPESIPSPAHPTLPARKPVPVSQPDPVLQGEQPAPPPPALARPPQKPEAGRSFRMLLDDLDAQKVSR